MKKLTLLEFLINCIRRNSTTGYIFVENKLQFHRSQK